MQRLFDIVFSTLALIALSPAYSNLLMLRVSERVRFSFQNVSESMGSSLIWFGNLPLMLKNSPNMGTGTITMKDDPEFFHLEGSSGNKINELYSS